MRYASSASRLMHGKTGTLVGTIEPLVSTASAVAPRLRVDIQLQGDNPEASAAATGSGPCRAGPGLGRHGGDGEAARRGARARTAAGGTPPAGAPAASRPPLTSKRARFGSGPRLAAGRDQSRGRLVEGSRRPACTSRLFGRSGTSGGQCWGPFARWTRVVGRYLRAPASAIGAQRGHIGPSSRQKLAIERYPAVSVSQRFNHERSDENRRRTRTLRWPDCFTR